ncbi:MAG: PQQ-binding-like beta-propeller repeat protein [bacterium]
MMFKEKAVKGLICLVVIGMLASSGWTIAKKVTQGTETKDSGTQTVEPTLIMEYKFDEPITDVIFDEATMTVKEARTLGMKGLEKRKATETVKVQYPKVLVTEKAVRFLDEKGRIEREVALKKENYEELMVSLATGKIIVKGVKGEGENRYRYLRWIDEKERTVKIEEGGEVFSVLISENGKYVVSGGEDLSAVEGSPICTLYDINGNELWRRKTEGDSSEVKILYDGKVLILEFFIMDKTRITLININGTKLWEKNLPATPDYNVLFTNDDKIIVYAFEIGKLYAFDKKGNLLWQPFNNSLHYLSISKNANYLAGLTSWDHLWAMDINTGKFIWKYPLEGNKPDRYYPDTIQISSNSKYILYKLKESLSLLLDGKSGKALKQIKGGGRFLGTDQIWRIKDNKIEIFNISDILKEGN